MDSSDSSDSGSDYKKHKDKDKKKEKKDKDKKGEQHHGHDHHRDGQHGCGTGPVVSQIPHHTTTPADPMSGGGATFDRFPEPQHHHEQQPFGQDCRGTSGGEHGQMPEVVYRPPATLPTTPPASGYRLPLIATSFFPNNVSQTGPPPFYDADGVSPVFIGSAILEKSVHPCKIGPHLRPFPSVPYGGEEYKHQGRFDLLPFRKDLMEWVRTSGGRIPSGRRPVEGGYEETGEKLYHAVGLVKGVKVPGKTGQHLYVVCGFIYLVYVDG